MYRLITNPIDKLFKLKYRFYVNAIYQLDALIY